MLSEQQLEQLRAESQYGVDLFLQAVASAPRPALEQVQRDLDRLFEAGETLQVMALWKTFAAVLSVVSCELATGDVI